MMSASPDPRATRRAIDVFLRYAYDGPLPIRVRSQLKVLEAWKGTFIRCSIFNEDPATRGRRYCVRLGNEVYPHMKLAIELSPGGDQYLFRVDTHDRHLLPDSKLPEYAEFVKVVDRNRRLAEEIDDAMTSEGLPTVKAYERNSAAKRGVSVY